MSCDFAADFADDIDSAEMCHMGSSLRDDLQYQMSTEREGNAFDGATTKTKLTLE